jgi:hypothetical protein
LSAGTAKSKRYNSLDEKVKRVNNTKNNVNKGKSRLLALGLQWAFDLQETFDLQWIISGLSKTHGTKT